MAGCLSTWLAFDWFPLLRAERRAGALQCKSIVTAFSVFQQGCTWIPTATEKDPLHASLAEETERRPEITVCPGDGTSWSICLIWGVWDLRFLFVITICMLYLSNVCYCWMSAVNIWLNSLCGGNCGNLCQKKHTLQMLQFLLVATRHNKSHSFPFKLLLYICLYSVWDLPDVLCCH